MKLAIFTILIFTLQTQNQSYAASFFGGNAKPSKTEAGTCPDCDRRAFQGREIGLMDANYVSASGGSMSEARRHFEHFARNNSHCRPSGNEKKYGMISDMSQGTGRNLSHIVEVDRNGKTTIVSSFWVGEGQGVSNECGSNSSPHGFIKMGGADFRPDAPAMDSKTGEPILDAVTGRGLISSWPKCGERNPGFQFNRIILSGLEPGYNDNLSEAEVSKNPNNPILCKNPAGVPIPRYARLHSISYASGNTTQGCKGLPLEAWCEWAPRLQGGCLYNYDGSASPAVRGVAL